MGRPCWFVYLDHTLQAAPLGGAPVSACTGRAVTLSWDNKTRNSPSPSPISILRKGNIVRLVVVQ